MEEPTDLGYQQALRYAEELRELYESERARRAELESAQGQLRETEARYRSLVERLPAIVYRADFGESGEWTYVSPQIESILGFTPEEWMADPKLWYRQIHPEDRERAMADEARIVDTGEPLVSQYRILTRDGSVLWFRDEAVVVREDAAGRPLGLQGIMYNITEAKQSEEALRRYTERVESLRQIDLAILSAETIEDLIRAAFSRLQPLVPSRRATVWLMDFEAGIATVFASSTTPLARVAPGIQYPIERWGSVGETVLQKLRSGEVDLRHDLANELDVSPGLQVLKDEGIRSLLVAPLLEQGDLMGVMALYADAPGAFVPEHVEIAREVANQLAIAIHQNQLRKKLEEELSERKRAQEEMRRSEARKSAILESAMDCVITINHEGNVVEFNPAAEETFGYSRDEAVGKPLADLIIPPSLRQAHREGIARYLETGEGPVLGKRLELTGMRADRTEFPVELAITRVDVPGHPLFTGYLRDITQRKRAERELGETVQTLRRTDEQRQQLLSRLVSAQEEERSRIAGDIHDDTIQVMTAVGIRLDLLRRAIQDPKQLALLEQLDETITLTVTRLRNLLFELRPPALDREGLAAALRTLLEQNHNDHGQAYTLENRLTHEPPTEARVILYRIAHETLSNVRKHSRASKVDVVLDNQDGGFLTRITDDGVGFSLEEGDRYRPGHLGLVSLRERAEMAGGWCRIESAPGAGTTVEVWVPSEAGGIDEEVAS